METLHYYVLHTLFPLLGYLDDQHGELLELWMNSLDFGEFPNLIEYYTSNGNGTLLMKSTLLLKIVHYFRILII